MWKKNDEEINDKNAFSFVKSLSTFQVVNVHICTVIRNVLDLMNERVMETL